MGKLKIEYTFYFDEHDYTIYTEIVSSFLCELVV